MIARVPKASGSAAPRQVSPWQVEARAWLPRVVSARLLALVPVVGFLLSAARHGKLQAPGAVFGAILLASVANLLVFLSHRHGRGSDRWARHLLFASLLLDLPVILLVAHELGGLGGPLVAFILLPVMFAGFTLGEKQGGIVALSGVLLLVIAGGTVDAPGNRADPTAGALLLAALLAAIALPLLWYRRRDRFLEARVSELEDERSRWLRSQARAERHAPVPDPHVTADAAAQLARDLAGPTGSLRRRLAALRRTAQQGPGDPLDLDDLDAAIREIDRIVDLRRSVAPGEEPDDPGDRVDLAQVVREVKVEVERDFERLNVRLRVHSRSDLPPALAASEEVRLVVAHLLYAVKEAAGAQGRASRVDLRFGTARQRVWLECEDSLPVADDVLARPDVVVDRRRPAHREALRFARTVALRRGGDVWLSRSSRGGLLVGVSFAIADRAGVDQPADRGTPR